MNKAQLELVLRQSEAHVVLGARHISRQKEIIAELERRGHDTDQARSLLVLFEELQVVHVQHRDRLIKQLAEFSD